LRAWDRPQAPPSSLLLFAENLEPDVPLVSGVPVETMAGLRPSDSL